MKKVKYSKTVEFLGRNGRFKASGLDIFSSQRDHIVTLAPLTSRGDVARCEIEIPHDNLAEVISDLQKIQADLDAHKHHRHALDRMADDGCPLSGEAEAA